MSGTKKSPATDPLVLLNRIKATFPEISWSKFQYLDVGWDHEVIILDDKLVFRFPNDAEYSKSLQTEIEALRRLRPLVWSVGVPNYTFVAPDYSFAGYEFLDGQGLSGRYFNDLTSHERNEIAKKIAAFLSVMHGVIKNGHDFNTVPVSDMLKTQQKDKRLSKKYLMPALSPVDYAIVKAVLADIDMILSQDLPSALIHGDIYSAHLLWNKQSRELSIIDFSDMNRGDPAFDFAELHEYGDAFVREVYDHYTGLKDETFLDRTKVYQKWVGVFVMVEHFIHHKTSFEQARDTFDRSKFL